MLNETDGQKLIETFFKALHLRKLDQCRIVVKSLEDRARQQPALEPWRAYLQGILAFEAPDWAEAERIFIKLLQTKLEPGLHGRVLYALGRSFDAQGRWQEAITTFEQSLSIAAEFGQTVEKARAWKHMAISYRKGFTRGDFGSEVLQQAIAYCQLALGALESIPDSDITWLKGSVWNTLGLIHRSLGQWDQAIACYRQDLDICLVLDDRHGMGLTYGNLGEIYQKQKRWPEALAAYQQALSLIREFDDLYEETESLANLAFLHQEMSEYETALDYYDRAIKIIEALRAGVSSEAGRAGFFATTVDTYANTVLLCLETGREAQAFDYAERARSRAFLDVLATDAPRHDLSRKIEAGIITLAEVQAALPTDTLLLEYFTTGLEEVRLDRKVSRPGTHRHRFPPARTLIFAITHDGCRVYDAALSPNDLRPGRLNSVVERHFLKPRMRRALYDKLITPVEKLLRDKRRLYLVPHGPLHYIPFQALIAADGDTLLRREGPQLVYGPSATLLFRYGRTESGQASASCLALGYNGEGGRLRFAEEESRSIARLTAGQTLTGSSPKKAALYEQAANYRLLHFSCHGEFDPESPLASALHLGAGETLTALDVLDHLRLRCDLVTLSACESGLSRVRRGDELIGLMRAFMYAGAPALVSTLWRVDERSTAILMERFYREIQAGVGFAEALKQAQLYLRGLTRREAMDILARLLPPAGETPGDRSPVKQIQPHEEKIFADPYYWAPFILIGAHGS